MSSWASNLRLYLYVILIMSTLGCIKDGVATAAFFSLVSCGLREEIVYGDIYLKENYSL